MLTQSSYAVALGVYLFAGVMLALLARRWLLPRTARLRGALLIGLLLALLLAPALPRPGMDSFAPALIVALFQWFTAGPEGAEHALRPLALALALGLLGGLLVGLLQHLRARRQASG